MQPTLIIPALATLHGMRMHVGRHILSTEGVLFGMSPTVGHTEKAIRLLLLCGMG